MIHSTFVYLRSKFHIPSSEYHIMSTTITKRPNLPPPDWSIVFFSKPIITWTPLFASSLYKENLHLFFLTYQLVGPHFLAAFDQLLHGSFLLWTHSYDFSFPLLLPIENVRSRHLPLHGSVRDPVLDGLLDFSQRLEGVILLCSSLFPVRLSYQFSLCPTSATFARPLPREGG